MEYLLLLLLPSILWILFAKWKWKLTVTWGEAGLQAAIVIAVVSGVWLAGKYGQTHDVEIWNGQITGKDRIHDSYVRTYQCNCYQSCSGTGSSRSCHQVCQTCFEDRYTVTWELYSTIGKYTVDHLDSTSRSVYKKPDPKLYVETNKGDACSKEVSYTNYVQAAPDSLFNMARGQALVKQFQHLIPAYPRVYSLHKANLVISQGVPIKNIKKWNERLRNHLRTVGPQKQANIIIVLARTADQQYRHALEYAWLGANKNDVVVLIGSSNYPKIDWADTITFGKNSGNSLLTVEINNSILKLGTLEKGDEIIDSVAKLVATKFDRKSMSDYEYLKNEIEPPTWVVVLAALLSIILSAILTFVFHRNEFVSSGYHQRRNGFPRRFR